LALNEFSIKFLHPPHNRFQRSVFKSQQPYHIALEPGGYYFMMLNPTVLSDIKTIIHSAREKAIRAVDTERVLMYWHIGQRIFLEEQEGKDRADYGKFLIKTLSEQLQPEFGSGYSIRQLERYRQFYRFFPITSTLSTQLSWSHYMHLLSIDHQNRRDFYIAETVKNNWSVR